MKKLNLVLLAIILLVLMPLGSTGLCNALPEPTPTPTTGQLSGMVYWKDDGEAAKDIIVFLNNPLSGKDNTLETYQCELDAEGEFIFTDIIPGSYILTIWWINKAGMPEEAYSGFNVTAPGVKPVNEEISSYFEGYSQDGAWAWATDFGTILINADDILIQDIEFTHRK